MPKKAKKLKKIEVVEVTCKCGTVLGSFNPSDDHSGVAVLCPKCKAMVEIGNNWLCEFLDDNLYDNPCEVDGCDWRKYTTKARF